MTDNDIIIKAVLGGTVIEVAFMLTPVQYIHWQYLRGENHPERYSIPLNQNVVGETVALLEHLE